MSEEQKKLYRDKAYLDAVIHDAKATIISGHASAMAIGGVELSKDYLQKVRGIAADLQLQLADLQLQLADLDEDRTP